jgi:hypothetical protein
MSRFRFELAGPADDADLRHVLAATPMEGHLVVRFEREPSWFGAAVVDGHFRQVVACRDTETGRIVGFGCRSVRELYVNGRRAQVGYLSSLRLLADHRSRGLVARGYRLFRELHADGRARLYLTTIAAGNRTAIKVLTGGRAGLPAYHPAGAYHTLAIPLPRRKPRRPPNGAVRPARAEELPAVVDFLREVGPRRQFFPHYRPEDFGSADGLLRDLRVEDVLVAWSGGRVVGALAGWEQHGFRQHVVQGYSGWLRRLRPLLNGWAWLRGRPGLPAPGEPLRCLTAALPVVAGDDAGVFAALLDAVRARAAGGPWSHLLLGLHEADPLMPAARRYQAACYTTNLYLVCWEDGEPERAALDGRPPYLELGSL